jgi:tRNA (mo5U34)-methyltransferase
MAFSLTTTDQELTDLVSSLTWYHTVDLGNGVLTPGHYDHRPYLHYYRLPDDLRGKTVLDIGAASGFFSFEFERRGAQVTATELPAWFDHDFGPNYQADHTAESGQVYLHQPFEVARQLRKSTVAVNYINIYDISPGTVGMFDLVFCGSVLIHLTDPLKALWRIASVTKDKAIIATSLDPNEPERPIATMVGAECGDGWWIPTRACLELMAVAAGFVGIEWVSEFQLNYRDQDTGPYHGVLHAYKTTANWTPQTLHREEVIERHRHIPPVPTTDLAKVSELQAQLQVQQHEIARLRGLVQGYENGRMMRFLRWVQKEISTSNLGALFAKP